jgi:hypothetical protein
MKALAIFLSFILLILGSILFLKVYNSPKYAVPLEKMSQRELEHINTLEPTDADADILDF